MKKLLPILAAAALLILLAVPAAQALSTRLGDLADDSFDCIAGGSAEEIAPVALPGGASSICIRNPTATCVSLGGPTIVHPAGLEIGDGCDNGTTVCVDARRLWCDADAGTVTVYRVWGVQ